MNQFLPHSHFDFRSFVHLLHAMVSSQNGMCKLDAANQRQDRLSLRLITEIKKLNQGKSKSNFREPTIKYTGVHGSEKTFEIDIL
jgi:hypothetical protein